MRSAAQWYIDERNSRRVRRAQLRAPATAPRHRLASCIEEALRLAALPGESEGRVYYFRRIRIVGLPADGDRRAWLSLFQRALAESAATAIHGADQRADVATAVFFRSRQEALEILLRRVLARRLLREWFWPTVLTGSVPAPVPGAGAAAEFLELSRTVIQYSIDVGAALPPAVGVPAILEALRMTPAGWSAVAAAVFAAPGIDPVDLLEAIPASVAQSWLSEIDTGRPLPAHARPANLPFAQTLVRTVLRTFGLASPHTEWFAAMALLRESPADLPAGILVERARLGLSNMLSKSVQPAPRSISAQIPVSEIPAAVDPVPPNAVLPADNRPAIDALAVPNAIAPAASPAPQPAPSPAGRVPKSCEYMPAWLEGAPTAAGGLFFLLNVLARIGMPEAIASGLAAGHPDFLPRLLLSFTRLAAVPSTDPVVVWLESQLEADSRETEVPARLVRFWAIAVRRWCWRMGRISVKEVVNRPGLFSVNRTDLDVSLPLDEAETRIRRVGLDLDPGWLPWFGWVVRFHYSYRGRLDA